MIESGANAIDPDLEFADLLERVAQRIQKGDVLDQEAIRSECPEHAERLCKMLPALELLADVSEWGVVSRGDPPPDIAPAPAAAAADRRGVLGDFRIVREIGCGGMGVVYEAEQISLQRRVALKVLPFASMLDSRTLVRFQNESHAAASLAHPNIVQISTINLQHDRGHYRVIARLTRWSRRNKPIVLAVAVAQCGALARDDASLALAERTSLSEGYFALAEVCEEAIGLAPTGPMEAGAVVRPLVVPPILIPETSVGW